MTLPKSTLYGRLTHSLFKDVQSAIASVLPKFRQLPEDWQHEFDREITDINFERSRQVAKTGLFVSIITLNSHSHMFLPAHVEPAMYAVCTATLVSSVLFLLFTLKTSPYNQLAAKVYAIVLLVILNGLSVIVWKIAGVTTPFIAGIFLFAVAFYYPGKVSLLLFALNFAVHLLIIRTIPLDMASATDAYRYGFIAYVSDSVSTVGAWVFMRLGIEGRKLSFLNRKTIEQKTNELAQANAQISELNAQLDSDNRRMHTELDVARRIQQMLLPKPAELKSISGLDIAAFMEPATEVGGDYYDVLPQGNGAKIGIGDITDHGLESGVLMLMVQTAVRVLTESGETDPVRFNSILNRAVYDNIQRMGSDRSLTLSLLDYENGKFRLSGQHEQAIVVRASGVLETISTNELGLPIGWEREIAEFIDWKNCELHTGDVLILYTDGITEAENPERELYGLQRLCEIGARSHEGSAGEICDAIIRDVQTYIGTANLYDDITLVVCKQQ